MSACKPWPWRVRKTVKLCDMYAAGKSTLGTTVFFRVRVPSPRIHAAVTVVGFNYKAGGLGAPTGPSDANPSTLAVNPMVGVLDPAADVALSATIGNDGALVSPLAPFSGSPFTVQSVFEIAESGIEWWQFAATLFPAFVPVDPTPLVAVVWFQPVATSNMSREEWVALRSQCELFVTVKGADISVV